HLRDRVPDVQRVMLDPACLRIELTELTCDAGDALAALVENRGPRAGGALIDGKHVWSRHPALLPTGRIGLASAKNKRKVRLSPKNNLQLCELLKSHETGEGSPPCHWFVRSASRSLRTTACVPFATSRCFIRRRTSRVNRSPSARPLMWTMERAGNKRR